MFSLVSVCSGGPYVTITHDVYHWSVTGHIPPDLDLFKPVHLGIRPLPVHTFICKRSVGLRLKGCLVRRILWLLYNAH